MSSDIPIESINNEINRATKILRSARVCIITKLVRKLKQTKAKSEEKGPAIIERLTSQLEYLKVGKLRVFCCVRLLQVFSVSRKLKKSGYACSPYASTKIRLMCSPQ